MQMQQFQKVTTLNKKSPFGKFILDSISIGMYNHPLMIYREYIQNSADAIDEICNKGGIPKNKGKIEITMDGGDRSVIITDNGCGISANMSYNALHDIGKSTKKLSVQRGFRGIGRLGALGYCEELKFTTKSKGEDIVSTSTWDCGKLRKLIREGHEALDAKDVLNRTVRYLKSKYDGKKDDHYFMVEMKNIRCSRDYLLNVPAVKSYIAQTAPVPFNYSSFKFSELIDKELRKKVPNYDTYNIYVNGEQIFKPYVDSVAINKSVVDKIKDINFITFNHDKDLLAFGWLADINLLGAINTSQGIEGIRLRSGNILIGDKNIVSGFFRETRFNNYLIGEIHTASDQLILNSRRDDFEDNKHKEEFYSYFVKDIGLPYSKRIREASEARSAQINQLRQDNLLQVAKKMQRKGHLSKFHKNRVISELKRIANKKENGDNNEVKGLIEQVSNSEHFLKLNCKKIPKKMKLALESIFDIIYSKSNDKKNAESIINSIIENLEKSVLRARSK